MHIYKLSILVSSWFKAITASICFTLSSSLYKEDNENCAPKTHAQIALDRLKTKSQISQGIFL